MFRRASILVATALVVMAVLAPSAVAGNSAIKVWKWHDRNANGVWEGRARVRESRASPGGS